MTTGANSTTGWAGLNYRSCAHLMSGRSSEVSHRVDAAFFCMGAGYSNSAPPHDKQRVVIARPTKRDDITMVSVWIHLRVNCHGISRKPLDEIHHGWTIHETENSYLGGMLRHYGRRHDDADHRRSGCMSERPVFGNGGKPLPILSQGNLRR